MILNAFTVDVEEYFHATNIEKVLLPAKWHSQEFRVEYSTYKLLELLEELNTKGTFFTLGYIAQRHPKLVRDICQAGHELGSHGYGHRLVYHQTEKKFFADVYRSKRLLEDISQTKVLGYRAPNFSINEKTPWAYASLLKAGYLYDSSLYPVWHPRYKNTKQPSTPQKISIKLSEEDLKNTISSGMRNSSNKLGQDFYIFPLAVGKVNLCKKEINLPIAGGAYWRFFPKMFIKYFLKQNQKNQNFNNCYTHPWEIDPGQPRYEELDFLTKLRHYGGIKNLPFTIKEYLKLMPFTTLKSCAFSHWQDERFKN